LRFIITFYSQFEKKIIVFDKFKKEEGGEMVEERIEENSNVAESVDIKNLKEKLQKVSEYIDEENRGISELANKRKQVEDEADQVGIIISNLRDKLSNVDKIIDDEGNRVKKIKESRDSL